ncbi:hypothetical protein THIOSC15_2930025 [uncultured Thiomicrorhabdus sp.]
MRTKHSHKTHSIYKNHLTQRTIPHEIDKANPQISTDAIEVHRPQLRYGRDYRIYKNER